MTDLVTLAEAKAYLHVDGSAEDGTIALLIAAASDAVGELADLWDGTGDVPDRLKLAVLARVAVTFDSRTDLRTGEGEHRLIGPLHTQSI